MLCSLLVWLSCRKKVKAILWLLTQDSHSMIILNISSEATGPVVTKFYVDPSGAEGIKICSDGPVHMTNVAAMPVVSENF